MFRSFFYRDLYILVRDFKVPKFTQESQKGYWFEKRIIQYFKSDNRYDVQGITGDMQLMGVSAASGLRHETDLLIETNDKLFLFELKCRNNVAKNDLLIFNQKGLDYWIKFIQLDEVRPLYRVFVSKTKLEHPLKEFAYMWNIILVEPDLLPIPTIIGILQDDAKCQDLEIYAADKHVAVLEKGCRDLGSILKRKIAMPSVVCLDTSEMPYKGNLQISSDSMYLLHLQLNKRISRKFFDRSSHGYEDIVKRIEDQIGYTQEGKSK